MAKSYKDLSQDEKVIVDRLDEVSRGGRHTDYRPEYCKEVIANGLHLQWQWHIYILLGIDKKTFWNWREKHVEFAKACRFSEYLAQSKAADLLLEWADGSKPGNNPASIVIFLKKRFPPHYRQWKDPIKKMEEAQKLHSRGEITDEELANTVSALRTSIEAMLAPTKAEFEEKIEKLDEVLKNGSTISSTEKS